MWADIKTGSLLTNYHHRQSRLSMGNLIYCQLKKKKTHNRTPEKKKNGKKEYEVEYQETKPIKETILILIVHSEHALLVHWQNQLHLNTSVDLAFMVQEIKLAVSV